MSEFLSSDHGGVFIATLVLVVLVRQTRRALPVRQYTIASSLLKWVQVFLQIVLLVTLLYYPLLVTQEDLAGGFGTWLISLDIALAQGVVLIGLALVGFAVVEPVVSYSLKMMGSLLPVLAGVDFSAAFELEEGRRPRLVLHVLWIVFVLVSFLVLLALIAGGLVALVGGVYAVFWAIRFLLVETTDLQMMLFGMHDGSLGFDYPTDFKLTVMFSNIESSVQNRFGNETLAVLVGFGVVSFGVLIAILNALNALGRLGTTVQRADIRELRAAIRNIEREVRSLRRIG